ncbi:MAG: CoA-binding protein [Chloroflexi bacterium]|nr:CoA-binding protein [Chloroflexota bacterium]
MDEFFNPKSIAIIGASPTPDKVGFNFVDAPLTSGFKGDIYPVHPRASDILGLKVYPSIEDIGKPIDLAVIALNQYASVDAVEACGRLGVKGVVAVAGGFKEMGEEGEKLQARLVEAGRRYGVKILGPNTLGMINTHADLCSVFYPLKLRKGGASILSQSGGAGLSLMHTAADEGLGLSKWIGVGNRGGLEFADLLQYLSYDDRTKVIGAFMESTEDARSFVEIAGQAVLEKPIVVYKVGESELAKYSALTHTGTLAGPHKLALDAFGQFGILSVHSCHELVSVCKALATSSLPRGKRVGILTHTAGPSIIIVDELVRRGCHIPPLQDATVRKVEEIIGKNPPVVLKNPMDVAGLGFAAEPYGQLAEAMLSDPSFDILIAVYCLHKNWRFPSAELVAARAKYGKPIVACYVSDIEGVKGDREILSAGGIPTYTLPEATAQAAAGLVNYAMIRQKWGSR